MIVKKTFNIFRLWPHISHGMTIAIVWTLLVWLGTLTSLFHSFTINFTPIGVIGSALAIVIAFKNNTAYQRWWDARTAWGTLVNDSRSLGRMVISLYQTQQGSSLKEKDFPINCQSIIYKQIAFVQALRIQLRGLDDWIVLKKYLSEDEFEVIMDSANRPYKIHLMMACELRKAIQPDEYKWHITALEGLFNHFMNVQGVCEKIKGTPLLRQYDIFSRLFVLIFVILVPLGLLDIFGSNVGSSWIIIPLTLIIAFVFIVLERTGAANENPFENKSTDVALDAITNTIERDLKELLHEKNLPPKPAPVDGYLW